jgi:hypothetical protein
MGSFSQDLHGFGSADAFDLGAKLLIRTDSSGHIQNKRKVAGLFEA